LLQYRMTILGFLPNIGATEMIVIGVIMLLLFGRRLPEVGRSLGQGIVQFKKGLKDVQDEVSDAANAAESKPDPKQFDSAKAPMNAGEDQRVSHSDLQPEPVEPKNPGS
jgi:TatA/E family protein of Tat protein translocase